MTKRPSADIRKRILMVLREEPLTYAKLERKVNTGFRTIKASCEELATYGQVSIRKVEKHPSNGKPAYVLSLTEQGQKTIARKQ